MALTHTLNVRLRRLDWELWLGRIGLTARAVLYALVAYLTASVALGAESREADNHGALQLLGGQPLGRVALWAVACGFAAYAGWRAIEVVQADSWAKRAAQVGKALVYAGLTWTAVRLAIGQRGGGGKGKEIDFTARAFQLPGGRVLVALAGLAVAGVGVANFWRIFSGKYREALPNRRSKRSRRARAALEPVALVGLIGRGVVFVMVGAFVVLAALTHDAAKAGGLDAALRRLRHHSYGPPLLLVLAVGMLAYAFFCLMQARWEVDQSTS